jgi:crotonobetainyl-CoA:carnitine CoA-transferase CaiB-like acyl-CoA transferase
VVEDDVGEVAVPSVMPRLSRTPGRIANLGPALGNATDAVLREMLGCGVEELERLRRTGAI